MKEIGIVIITLGKTIKKTYTICLLAVKENCINHGVLTSRPLGLEQWQRLGYKKA